MPCEAAIPEVRRSFPDLFGGTGNIPFADIAIGTLCEHLQHQILTAPIRHRHFEGLRARSSVDPQPAEIDRFVDIMVDIRKPGPPS